MKAQRSQKKKDAAAQTYTKGLQPFFPELAWLTEAPGSNRPVKPQIQNANIHALKLKVPFSTHLAAKPDLNLHEAA